MCGINGYFGFKQKLNQEQIQRLITTMNGAILHRGPDDDGVFTQNNIGLGMRRLSIIDLSTGTQPIFNEEESLVIVFNGEIYNYKTLKQELLAKGHIFHTTSDTEVILHCYEEYGNKSFNKLKGMFAFAIFDLTCNKLIVARDRAGEKPLYFYHDSEQLLFASEMKSMISSRMISKNICKRALNQYLQLTYIPAPLTIFDNVYKLLPGHFLEVDCKGGIKVEQYWDVEYNKKELILDYNLCKRKLRSTMFSAVEECMVADVPIGAFLSGGIDSSIIVGIMSQISSSPINTFTIGHKDKQYDESDRAELTARFHKTNHNTYYLNYNDILPELDKIINNIDEPFADSSYLPTYMVSKYARQQVKTVLTGDAGDELFGGYNKYLIGYYSAQYNKIPKWVREYILEKVVFALPDNTPFTRKVRKVIDNSDKDIFDQRKSLMCLGFKQEELPCILKESFVKLDSTDFIKNYYNQLKEETGELSRALYTDLKVVLEGDMLAKVDRASMLCSIETRVPMLHKNVVELAAQIPYQYKINSKNTKIILKDTFIDLLPKELLHAKKSGFGIPLGKWMQNELKEELLNALNREWIEEQGIFQYSYIETILEEHFSNTKNRASELWTLYIFQKWFKECMHL